jgi:hypothetical protein
MSGHLPYTHSEYLEAFSVGHFSEESERNKNYCETIDGADFVTQVGECGELDDGDEADEESSVHEIGIAIE